MVKLETLRDVLHYSFGSEMFPERKDLYTTGVNFDFVNYEEITLNSKILNNFDTQMDRVVEGPQSSRNHFKDMFFGSGDVFSFVASCENGCTKGSMYEGETCRRCGTIIKAIDPNVFQFQSKFQLPEDYPPIIHPALYNLLKNWWGSIKKKPIIELMLTSRKSFPEELTEAGFEFGLSAFYRDFYKLVDFFSTRSKFVSKDVVRKSEHMKDIIFQNRHNIFIKDIPLLNNSLHVITSKKMLKNKKKSLEIGRGGAAAYTDSQAEIMMEMFSILDEITLSRISDRKVNLDTKMFKFSLVYYQYIQEVINKKLAKKKGFVQQHTVAGRFHNTFRGVISPVGHLSGMDEIFIPWKTGLSLFKCEIINLLRNRYGKSFKEALDIYYGSIEKYNPIVHEIFDTLMDECPFKGFPILWWRNPSLNKESIQFVFITRIKTDIEDKTISMHQGITAGFNADLTYFIIIQGPLRSNSEMITSLIAGNP